MTEQGKLDYLTRKWWFFLLFILLQFIPSYTSKGYDPAEAGSIPVEILSHTFVYDFPSLFPIFKIIPVILIISIIFLKNAVTRVFSVYAGITYLLFAFLQNIAITEKYGLGILTTNVIMLSLVAVFWFWEAFVQKNDFAAPKRAGWRYWVVPLRS